MAFWNRKKNEQRSSELCEETQYSSPTPLNFLQELLKNQKIPEFLSAFFCALELISNTIAQLPVYITNKKDETTPECEKVYDNLFNKGLLNKFNLLKNFIVDLYKKGNGFLYIIRDNDGKPVGLRYLNAEDVNIRYIKKQNVIYYTCPEVIKGQIPMEDMIHIFKNTTDGVTGKPITFYAGDTLKLAGLSERQAQEFFSNGCNISGVLTYQGNLSEKQRNEIRENWALTHSQDKSGVAVLPGSMDYKQLGQNAKDAQLLESRTFDIQAIARYFNISPALLGDGTKNTYNSLEQSELQLLVNCIGPLLRLIEEEANRKLYQGKYFLHFDENAILRTDKNSECNYYSNLVSKGIISVNEAREALGWAKIEKPEYDELIIPFTNINQNKIADNGSESNPDDDSDNDNKEGEDKTKIDENQDE